MNKPTTTSMAETTAVARTGRALAAAVACAIACAPVAVASAEVVAAVDAVQVEVIEARRVEPVDAEAAQRYLIELMRQVDGNAVTRAAAALMGGPRPHTIRAEAVAGADERALVGPLLERARGEAAALADMVDVDEAPNDGGADAPDAPVDGPQVRIIDNLDEALRQARPEREPAADGGDGDDDGDAAHFRGQVQSVSQSQSMSFNDKGEPGEPTHQLNVSLRVFWDPTKVRPLSYSSVNVRRAVTSSGEQLGARNQHNHERTIWHHNNHGQGWPEFNVALALEHPSLPTEKLDRLDATVQVKIARGPIRYVVLGPFEEVEDRPIKVEGFDNASLKIDRPGEDQIRFTIEGDLAQLFADDETKLLGADGLEVGSGGASTSRSGTTYRRTLRNTAMPDDGRIILGFYRSVEDIDLPIELTDLPLPGPPPDARGLGVALHVRMQDDPEVGER